MISLRQKRNPGFAKVDFREKNPHIKNKENLKGDNT